MALFVEMLNTFHVCSLGKIGLIFSLKPMLESQESALDTTLHFFVHLVLIYSLESKHTLHENFSQQEMFISNFPSIAGINIVHKALKVPCYQIAANAGADASEIVNKVIGSSTEIGYDALNSEFVDMVASGIIDPTKV